MKSFDPRTLLLTGVIASLAFAASCGKPEASNADNVEEDPAPAVTNRDAIHTRFMVLVDLSETWHNDRSRARNLGLLTAVNTAMATAAEPARNNPATLGYYLISANNYFAPLHCDAKYTVALIPGEEGFFERGPLLEYLNTCARAALETPTQSVTPISAAISTAVETMRDPPGQPATAKRIIILSDMKEEGGAPPPHEPNDLHGFEIIVLFRALPEDQANPTLLSERIERWRQELSTRGARVYIRPDTGVTATDLAAVLSEPLPQTRE